MKKNIFLIAMISLLSTSSAFSTETIIEDMTQDIHNKIINYLGNKYLKKGEECEKTPHTKEGTEQALRFYKKSAFLGNMYGEYYLGKIYLRMGGLDNDEKAKEIFQNQIAEYGNNDARTDLGNVYDAMAIIYQDQKADKDKIYKFYEQAAELGNSHAQAKVNKLKK